MRTFFLLFMCTAGSTAAQNNLRFISTGGQAFKVFLNGGAAVNTTAEASVLIEDIDKDTLNVTIEFENKLRTDAVIYLLEKGKKTVKKEYNYTVIPEKEAVKIVFAGIKEAVTLPKPIVPDKQ